MQHLLTPLRSGQALSPSEISQAVHWLTDPNAPSELKCEFLEALHAKGETAAEIAGFADTLLDMARAPGLDHTQLAGPMLDVCGTGGDRLNCSTFQPPACLSWLRVAPSLSNTATALSPPNAAAPMYWRHWVYALN